MVCHSLLQRIFLTQISNSGFLYGRQILNCLSYREVLKPIRGIHYFCYSVFIVSMFFSFLVLPLYFHLSADIVHLFLHSCVCSVASVISDSVRPPWTISQQTLLFMGFSQQEYWSGLPCPSPGDLPNPGIEPTSPMFVALQADSLLSEPPGTP